MTTKNYEYSVESGCESRVVSRRHARGTAARRRGSVLLEAALVSVFVLIPLTLAIIQYGIVFNATNTLSQVTREGARAAAVFALKEESKDPGIGMDADTYIRSRIQAAAASTSLDYNDMKDDIVITPAMNTATSTTRVKGEPIKVTISYDMKKKYFFPWLTGGGDSETGTFAALPPRIARTATMMIE